jgi:hypothetical protein
MIPADDNNLFSFLQMPRVQFIGQISLSFGNTLPELCSKLKNFGIGRMFIRTAQDQNRGNTIQNVDYLTISFYRSFICCIDPKSSNDNTNSAESNHW